MEKLERACISMHFLLKDQDKKEEKKIRTIDQMQFLGRPTEDIPNAKRFKLAFRKTFLNLFHPPNAYQ